MAFFKITRDKKIRAARADWELLRAHGTSRRKMVDFICSIGGYHGRGWPFAIEFNVSAWRADLDADTLWKVCRDDCEFGIAELPPREQVLAENLFRAAHAENEDEIFSWGVEEAYEGWADSDMPYETFYGERVQWSWSLEGRGGKHLCMTDCEGIDLRCTSEELERRLMAREESYDGRFGTYEIPTESVRKLFLICVQNYVELTAEKVGKEVEYRAAWRLWVSFCEDQLPTLVKADRLRDRLNASASAIRAALTDNADQEIRDDFETILALAGVRVEED